MAGEHYTICVLFSTYLQSGEVDASYQRTEPVCRFESTDSIENILT